MSDTERITSRVPVELPAARYQLRELAHAEALRTAVGTAPAHCDCYGRTCSHRIAYERWYAQVKQIASWVADEEKANRLMLCNKCGGRGITQWVHRCRGVCFQCKGDGWSAKGRRQYR